jgi:hypothetical protein
MNHEKMTIFFLMGPDEKTPTKPKKDVQFIWGKGKKREK